jgi:hypothetical protein
MNNVIAWLLDLLKAKNPTVFMVVVTILVSLFAGLTYLETATTLPVWAVSVIPFLKMVIAAIGVGLNSSTKEFRAKASAILLFLICGFSVNAQKLRPLQLTTVAELQAAISNGDQIGLHITSHVKSAANGRLVKVREKTLSIDTLSRVLGGSNSQVLPYKVYRAFLNKSMVQIGDGELPPVATVLENTLGFMPVWVHFEEGIDGFNFPSTPLSRKLVCLTNRYYGDGGGSTINKLAEAHVTLHTAGNGYILDNNSCYVEVRLYP